MSSSCSSLHFSTVQWHFRFILFSVKSRKACYGSSCRVLRFLCFLLACHPVSCFLITQLQKWAAENWKFLSLGVFLPCLASPSFASNTSFQFFLKFFFLLPNVHFCRQKFCQKTVSTFVVFIFRPPLPPSPNTEKHPRIYSLQLILKLMQKKLFLGSLALSRIQTLERYLERKFEFVTVLNNFIWAHK